MYVPPGVNSRKLSVKSSCTKFQTNLCRDVASFPSLSKPDIFTPTFQNTLKDSTKYIKDTSISGSGQGQVEVTTAKEMPKQSRYRQTVQCKVIWLSMVTAGKLAKDLPKQKTSTSQCHHSSCEFTNAVPRIPVDILVFSAASLLKALIPVQPVLCCVILLDLTS